MRKKPWIRGAVSLAVLAGLAAALIASPATAHFLHPSKAQVKKVAKKVATKVFNSKIGGASVANAAAVNGVGVHKIAFQTSAVVTKQTILDLNGLQLKASCGGVNSELFAATTITNGKLAATSRRVGLSFQEVEVDPFNPGTDVDLSPGQTDRELHGRVSYIGGDGRTVTILWNAEGSGTPNACNVWGVAFV